MSTNKFQTIIKKSFHILIDEQGYTQKLIFKKFQQIDITVSLSSISNLYSQSGQPSLRIQREAANGLVKILERDLCLRFEETTNSFEKIQNCTPRPIIENAPPAQRDTSLQKYTIHDGRLNIMHKVALYEHAKHEIIEIGTRLKSFNSYFSSKKTSAFEGPITRQLEAGVNFKCYIINPSSRMLERYVEDRLPSKLLIKEFIEETKKNASSLSTLFSRVNKKGYQGKMELYQYDHLPYYHASVADPNTERGLLYVSPYLFGISRANAPVIEVSHKEEKSLYKRYWKSIKALTSSQKISKIV